MNEEIKKDNSDTLLDTMINLVNKDEIHSVINSQKMM